MSHRKQFPKARGGNKRSGRGRNTNNSRNNQMLGIAGNVVAIPQRGPLTVAVPDAIECHLRFELNFQVANVGFLVSSNRYRSNAYDVDPILASTAMPGFAEWATMYEQFRVVGFRTEVTVCNNETFPLTALHGYTKDDLGGNGLALGYGGNPTFQQRLLSAKGGQDRYF